MDKLSTISADPYRLLEKFCAYAPAHSHFLILNHNNAEGSFTAAIGCSKAITVPQTGKAFSTLEAFCYQQKGDIFGYLGYDLKNETEKLHSANPDHTKFPVLTFFSPLYLFHFKAGQLETAFDPLRTDTFKAQEVRESILSIDTQPSKGKAATVNFTPLMSRSQYLEGVKKVLGHIQKGDVYELNFCQEFVAHNVVISPAEVFLRLNELTRAPFSCFGGFDGCFILSASPERFIRKRGDEIISQPIKGTAARGRNSEDDEKLRVKLRNDPKEQSENVMIVDLVRNDLSRIAQRNSVEVTELFGIYSFKTVHQMISTIKAKLRPGLSVVDVFKATFPMGSMTGAPKIKAMELIEQLEMSRRGVYSGAVGYISAAADFDFNVVIRSLLYNKTANTLSFQVGSAITANSDPEKEYEECLLKAKALFQAVSCKSFVDNA